MLFESFHVNNYASFGMLASDSAAELLSFNTNPGVLTLLSFYA